jgi:hypothetical protein
MRAKMTFDESEIEFALAMATDMLNAGAEQLKLYDPETEDPLKAVARIYYAMELVREAIEGAALVEMGVPLDKSKLN